MGDILYLREKANALPLCPGVYLMKNKDGKIIYVGKSKKLKNRVSSYFLSRAHSYKTEKMVQSVSDFDTILCDTEIEALTLENILIKKHSPKYNIKLKDAKSYPYIKITDEPYPKLIVTRERASDGSYYGPYSGMADAYAAADAIRKAFSLPNCKRSFPKDIGRERPCLYKQMGKCCAPCANSISQEAYNELIRAAKRTLDGKTSETVAELEREMLAFAEKEQFEDALRCRNSIFALKKLSEKQKAVTSDKTELDAISLYTDELCGVISVLSIREGLLISKNEFVFSSDEISDSEAFSAFLFEYYSSSSSLPRKILLDTVLEEEDLSPLSEHLRKRAGHRVLIHTPMRGEAKRLCEMAHSNAKERAARYRKEIEREDKALILLAKTLSLEILPERIEAFDISNIGSEHITASMVVYADGKMKRSDYRSFKIQSTDGVDDYGALREALTRRLSHIGDGSASLGDSPDLILLDGGVGHVGVGKSVLEALGLSIPIFGMVKDEHHKTRTLCDTENEFGIAHEQALYALIFRIQEEAHRFAVSHARDAKRKTLKKSVLCSIDGIGEKKAKTLLTFFGSVKRLSGAGVEDIASVRGITRADAERIVAFFEKKKKTEV